MAAQAVLSLDSRAVVRPQTDSELNIGRREEAFRGELVPHPRRSERWQRVEHSSIIDGAPGDCDRRHCQPVTEDHPPPNSAPLLTASHISPIITPSYLAKPSAAAPAADSCACMANPQGERRVSISVAFEHTPICRLQTLPPGAVPHLYCTLVSPLQLCLMNSAVITPTVILG